MSKQRQISRIARKYRLRNATVQRFLERYGSSRKVLTEVLRCEAAWQRQKRRMAS
jgi:hypothetical protein